MTDRTQRDALVVHLASSGVSFREIAETVGISAGYACTIAKRNGLSRRIVGIETCTLDGCDKSYAANGLCDMHYLRVQRHGTTELEPVAPYDRPAAAQRWRQDNPDKSREQTNGWRAKNPAKRRAHRKVEVEIRTGRLVRQHCQVCGEGKSQAHHDDYSKPLDLLWLCALHHKRRHVYLIRDDRDPDRTAS